MDSDVVVALRLAKEGFGSVEQILAMRADLVLDALEYAGFLADYQETMHQLNRDTK
jgi:hypothetical protein